MDEGERRRTVPGVSEYRIQLPDKIDARQLLLAFGLQVESKAPTLAEFAPRFVSQYAKANRQKPAGVFSKESHLRNYLLPLFGATKLDAISQEQVQQLKTELGARKAKTVNNILSTLSMILKVAMDWRIIDRMPVRIDPLPVLPPHVRFYEKDEYARLQLGGLSAGARELAVVLMGGDCGLRQGEMRALEWPDVDLARGQILVQRSMSLSQVVAPKGGKSRVVPVTPEMAEAFRRLPPTKKLVLTNQDEQKTRLSEQNIRTLLSRAQRAAGLSDPGATHILRHTFCSHLAMAGVPLLTIKELAGHSSERTTMRYMHLAPSEKGRAIEQLELYRRK